MVVHFADEARNKELRPNGPDNIYRWRIKATQPDGTWSVAFDATVHEFSKDSRSAAKLLALEQPTNEKGDTGGGSGGTVPAPVCCTAAEKVCGGKWRAVDGAGAEPLVKEPSLPSSLASPSSPSSE